MSDRGGRGSNKEHDDEPVLPDRSRDDSDVGWGDRERDGDRSERDAEWYRRERPPHHDRD